MNTNDITNFNGHQLRHVMIDGEPWFVATDVCNCLGLDLSKGSTNYTMRLDSDERQPLPLNLLRGKGMNQATIITESGLYKLIMRSDKPEAKEFQNWVTKVVLPSIRKTGGYLLNGHARIIDRWQELEEEFPLEALGRATVPLR